MNETIRRRFVLLCGIVLAPLLLIGWWDAQPLSPRVAVVRAEVERLEYIADTRERILATKARMEVAIGELEGAGKVKRWMLQRDIKAGYSLLGSFNGRMALAAGDSVPTYPGCEGWGCTALSDASGSGQNCRQKPLVVHHVTTLANSGTGSLRDIIENQIATANYDIVVFDTSGTITQTDRIVIGNNSDCLYVAGQSARGGIHVYTSVKNRGTFGFACAQGTCPGDLVFRYLHLTVEIDSVCGVNCIDNFGWSTFDVEYGWMMDHNSMFGGSDEILSYAPQKNRTPVSRINESQVSYNLQFGANEKHYTGGIMASFSHTQHHNFYSHAGWRVPANCGGSGDPQRTQVEYGMNVTYGWVNRQITINDSLCKVSVFNNLTEKGSALGIAEQHQWIQLPVKWQVDSAEIYIAGNVTDSLGITINDSTDDQWDAVCEADSDPGPACGGNNTVDSLIYEVAVPWTNATPAEFPLTSELAVTARDSMIGVAFAGGGNIQVGAYQYLECAGTTTRHITVADSLAVSNYFTRLGDRHTTTTAYAAIPIMNVSPSCTDTDGDGMPDTWENAHTNVSSSIVDANDDTDADGFLAIEEFLNFSDPDVFTNADGTETPTGGGPNATFSNGRFIYQDTLVEYLLITAGGTDTQTVLMPDTLVYKVTGTSVAVFAVTPKDISGAAEGDTVLILVNDSVAGNVINQLDSPQVDSLAGSIAVEGEWSRCASRGICTDSLRDRSIP